MAEVQVPSLVVARPLVDALAWRADQPAGGRSIALVTDGGSRLPAGALFSAGLQVSGLLGPDALESIAWAAEVGVHRAYADLPALLSDEVESVAVDLPAPRCDVLITAAAKAGLNLLLTSPRLGDPRSAGRAVLTLEDANRTHAVAFRGRADPAYALMGSALQALGPVTQVTARGWPAGRPPRAELVDLVRRWCGDVVAACADPEAMPASSLGDDEPVTLALLTETGTTVLVSERFAARQADVLLTGVTGAGRAVLIGDTLTVGGAATTVDRGTAAGAVTLAARALLELDTAATLNDLIAAWQVLDAVERSRTEGGWAELA